MLRGESARHSVAIVGMALLGGLIVRDLVRWLPASIPTKHQLDPSLNAESLRRFGSASGSTTFLRYYSDSLKRGVHGDLGVVASPWTASEEACLRDRCAALRSE